MSFKILLDDRLSTADILVTKKPVRLLYCYQNGVEYKEASSALTNDVLASNTLPMIVVSVFGA